MAYLIKVRDENELDNIVHSKDKNLSVEIVKIILDNLDTKKRFINVLEIHIEESDLILDITADRRDFIDTLEKNLNILILHEEYEICAKVKEGIEYLKENL